MQDRAQVTFEQEQLQGVCEQAVLLRPRDA